MIFRYSRYLAPILVCFFITQPAFADDDWIDGVFRFGVAGGGDTLVSVIYPDFTVGSISAGDGIFVAFGAVFNVSNAFSAELSLGSRNSTLKKDPDDPFSTTVMTHSLVFVDALGYYELNMLRVGLGITHHINNYVEGSDIFSGARLDLDDATGFLAEINYVLGKGQNDIGVRRTAIEYESPTRTYNGDSTSLYWRHLF